MFRSGSFNSRGAGKRQIKTQGSSKIDNICTARMKVKEDILSTEIIVMCISINWNHEMNLAHLPIPKPVVLNIASQLHQGVPVQTILDKIRDGDIDGDCFGHEHLINPQQIYNIRRQLNLRAVEKHKLDPASVLHWVTELQQQDYNPVLYYKAQGEEADNLNGDDFLLGKYIQ